MGAWALSLSCNRFTVMAHFWWWGFAVLRRWANPKFVTQVTLRFQIDTCSLNNPSGIPSWKVRRGRPVLLQEATNHRPARCQIIHTVSQVKISQVDDPKEVPQIQLYSTSYRYGSPANWLRPIQRSTKTENYLRLRLTGNTVHALGCY